MNWPQASQIGSSKYPGGDNRGVLFNAAMLPLDGLHTLTSDGTSYRSRWVARRIENYHLAMEHARLLIQNSSIRFSFIHLPVPHFPAVYDRKARKLLESRFVSGQSGSCGRRSRRIAGPTEADTRLVGTTLIISGDHSWRPWLWRELKFWAAEDEAAARGRFDSRPVLLVHLPGQDSTYAFAAKYPAFELEYMIKAAMHGDIRGVDDLVQQTYTRENRPTAPPILQASIGFGK